MRMILTILFIMLFTHFLLYSVNADENNETIAETDNPPAQNQVSATSEATEENLILINGKFFNADKHEGLVNTLFVEGNISRAEASMLVKLAVAMNPAMGDLPTEDAAKLTNAYKSGDLDHAITSLSRHIENRKQQKVKDKMAGSGTQ